MDLYNAEVGATPRNDSGEDDSDPTRRDVDGDAEGWIEVTYKRKGRVSSGEETAQKGTRSRSPTRRGPDPDQTLGWEPGDYVVWGQDPEADPGPGAGRDPPRCEGRPKRQRSSKENRRRQTRWAGQT
ncbi:hypothetical protein MRX96_007203 [Rhipicephalus microplus]